MNKQLHPVQSNTQKLHNHQMLRLSDAQPGTAIECKEGVLWVTSAGDACDHVLFPGDRYQPAGKKVIIEAMRESLVEFCHN